MHPSGMSKTTMHLRQAASQDLRWEIRDSLSSLHSMHGWENRSSLCLANDCGNASFFRPVQGYSNVFFL